MNKLREIFSVIFRSGRGRMSQDIDPRYLKDGDFVDALNNRSTTTSGSSTGDRESVLGNELAFTLPSVGFQNKEYRIYLDNTNDLRTVTIFDGNGVQVGLPATWTPTGAAGGLATAYTNATTTAVTSIGARLTAAGWAGSAYTIGALVVMIPDTSGYFDLTLGLYTGWDYTLTMVSDYPDPLPLVIAEAIDFSMVGQLKCIGSYDLAGELYVWSTPQDNLPTEVAVLGITNPAGTIIRVEIADTSIFDNNGVLVLINGVLGTLEANGNWIINIIDSTHFDLNGAIFVNAYTSGGVVTVNPISVGEVGRAVRNENDQTWTYFTLIRSRVFNFRTIKQVKTYCEKSATTKSLYWTDDYNVPRVLYDRTIDYQDDCLLTFVDPLNTYDYGTLDIESRLILNATDLTFIFTSQTQAGGQIPSGNSRYTVRGVTESNTFTDWLLLSNPIPAATASEDGNGDNFFGDAAGVLTSKINNFLVQGNILGIFKFIELACVNYLDGSTNSFIVRRDEVTSNSFILQHTGFELNTQDLDTGTLSAFTQVYTKAKNIDALAGSLILSNLETSNEADLTDFFANLEYSVERTTVVPTTRFSSGNQVNVGEYEIADNVYEETGHMINERYRLAGVVQWQSGGMSKAFHIADAIMDRSVQPRKTVNIPDYDLIDASFEPYSYYFKVQVNENTTVGNRKLKDFVKRIYIMRCPMDSPQIKASGVAVAGVSARLLNTAAGKTTFVDWAVGAVGSKFGEFPLVAGWDESTATVPFPVDPAYGGVYAVDNNFVVQRKYAALYFPDLFMNNSAITPVANSDVIYNFGQSLFSIGSYVDTPYKDYLYEDTNITPLGLTAFDTLNLQEAHFIATGSNTTFTATGDVFSKRLLYLVENFIGTDPLVGNTPGSWVVLTDTAGGFKKLTTASDRGFYRCQWSNAPSRTFNDQYGSLIASKYMWTGALFTTNNGETEVSVFGGDTFTQRCCYKTRYPNQNNVGARNGFGQGSWFYTQNRINFQMRETSSIIPAFPQISVQTWLTNINTETLVYNRGYNASTITLDTPQLVAAFNPDPDAQNTDLPVRIAYSNVKIPESAQDSYRIFLPLSFKDLDYKSGEINHHAIANQELITWQVLLLMRQFFDPTGMLKSVNGAEIILGDGAKLQRRGVQLTSYGTKNGFGIIHGKSSGGDDVFYYIDTTNRACFRLHLFADGTVNLGTVHGMDSWFANRLRFVDGIDTPAHGEGICGTWNERNKEAIFTVRGQKEVDEWGISEFLYSDVYDFLDNGTGKQPAGDLVSDGTYLYGCAQGGGSHIAFGCLYRYNPVTDTYADIHDFNTGAGGSNPISGMVRIGAVLYGATRLGGANNLGTLFSWDTGTNTYTVLHDFATATGFAVAGTMIVDAGIIYGACLSGGANSVGTLFKWDGAYTDLYDFDTADGANPVSGLVKDTVSSGLLFGVTQAGGSNGDGVIYQWNIGAALYSNLYTMNNANLDGRLGGALIATASDPELLYGTATDGGLHGDGTFYTFNIITNVFTKITDFEAAVTGATPIKSIIEYQGSIYGVTSQGGANSLGVIWRFMESGTSLQNIHDFASATGRIPNSGLTLFSGSFYGVGQAGGANNVGVIYKLTPDVAIYSIGDEVWYGTQGFEQFQQIYVSLIDNNEDLQPDTHPLAWEAIAPDDPDYYNNYTLCFNELTNGFDTFYSFKPKIYLGYKNTYLSPKPIESEGGIYEHGTGLISVWYVTQIIDGYFSFVINAFPEAIKRYLATMWRTNVVPERVDIVSSDGQVTFMISTEFDFKEGNWRTAVKNDLTTGGKIVGDYCKVTLTFKSQIMQRLYQMAMRVKIRSRNIQS